MAETLIVFDNDPRKEHDTLKTLILSLGLHQWEVGARLSRLKSTGDWQNIGDPPFTDWTDYLCTGLEMSPTTAYKYISAAWFPRVEVEREGADKLYFLKKITDVTVVDETPEQALALELPLLDGGLKAFRQMTVREVEQAYRLIRDGEGRARRPPRVVDQQVTALKQTAEAAVSGMIEPHQIAARKKGSNLLLDVKGVPREQAAEVFAALSAALAEQQ